VGKKRNAAVVGDGKKHRPLGDSECGQSKAGTPRRGRNKNNAKKPPKVTKHPGKVPSCRGGVRMGGEQRLRANRTFDEIEKQPLWPPRRPNGVWKTNLSGKKKRDQVSGGERNKGGIKPKRRKKRKRRGTGIGRGKEGEQRGTRLETGQDEDWEVLGDPTGKFPAKMEDIRKGNCPGESDDG